MKCTLTSHYNVVPLELLISVILLVSMSSVSFALKTEKFLSICAGTFSEKGDSNLVALLKVKHQVNTVRTGKRISTHLKICLIVVLICVVSVNPNREGKAIRRICGVFFQGGPFLLCGSPESTKNA
jgi:hypothetical protein